MPLELISRRILISFYNRHIVYSSGTFHIICNILWFGRPQSTPHSLCYRFVTFIATHTGSVISYLQCFSGFVFVLTNAERHWNFISFMSEQKNHILVLERISPWKWSVKYSKVDVLVCGSVFWNVNAWTDSAIKSLKHLWFEKGKKYSVQSIHASSSPCFVWRLVGCDRGDCASLFPEWVRYWHFHFWYSATLRLVFWLHL